MHTLRRCAICDVASIAYACAWSFSRDTCRPEWPEWPANGRRVLQLLAAQLRARTREGD